MSYFDELNRLKPLHACSCGLCTCGLAAKFAADREEEKLHQFMIGIDDEIYGTVRSNLLSHTPMPDLNRAYQAFIQEENSRAAARGKAVEIDGQAFALHLDRQSKGKHEKPDRTKLLCTHCKKKGHDVGSCFKLLGYPDWWEDRNRSNGGTVGRGGGVKTHAVTATGEGSTSTTDAKGLSQLSQEQVHALLNLLNNETRSSDRMAGPSLEEPDWSR
ncbi:unnamed protein product [Cuscuta epithymum]|uniref:Uncharacterized protein n=1 Tax=Cuscuta epithymum TaxID=186058 RepID=A0AAV0DWA3_9ASTE|nr:unnamed protein product [Cuscuta epithymum]